MNRARSLTVAAAAVVLLHRLYDCLFNINPATGFYDNDGDPVRFLVLAAAAAAVLTCANAAPVQGRLLALRANIFVSALLGTGAVMVFAGCAHTLLLLHTLRLPAARILGLAAGIVGLLCAAWLCVAAFWFVRGRKTSFSLLLSFCLFPAWLCLRAVSVFAGTTVNVHDSVTLARLFCPVALACCWLTLLKALNARGETDRSFYPVQLAGFLLSVCVGLPTALVCARAGNAAGVSFFLADALCGTAAALIAADTKPTLKGAQTDAQQQ